MSKSTTKIGSINDFISRIRELTGDLLLYRGLSDKGWKVEAAAYRRIKNQQVRFQDYIKDLLTEAKKRAFSFGHRQNKELNDLELLAELQHNGAATCLIDFTTNPLIALWFACREHPEEDGKVVAVPTDNLERFKTVTSDIIKEKGEVEDLRKEGGIELLLKGNTLWKWQPWDINNRIIAQQSIFLLGRPNIGKNYYKEITVPNKIKNDLLKDLETFFGISETSLFRDLPGFSLANAHDKEYIPPDYSAQGVNKHQNNDFEEAITDYDKAIKLDPKNAKAHYNRGVAKQALGTTKDLKEALKDYDQAIDRDENFTYAYCNRGNVKRALGNTEGAIADYNQAIILDPSDAAAYNNRGNAKQALEDYAGAIEDCNQAIDRDENFTYAYCNRGNAKQALGNTEGAIVDYNKALELDPDDAKTYYNRGNAKKDLEDYEGALKDYDQAIRLDPKNAGIYNNRGNAKYELWNYEESIKDYDEAIRLDPKAIAFNNRGNAKQVLGDYEGAIKDYDEAIRLDKNYTVAYCNRGNAKRALGNPKDLKEAIKDYNEALKLDPNFATAYYNRGLANKALGKTEEAEKDFAKAKELRNKRTD